MSSSRRGKPDLDPYDILGVAFGASDAEITKAYRKLALKLHPDKQKPGLSKTEADAVSKRFHEIKEARSFLLDAENAEDRRAFDAKRESDRIRRETEAVRDQQMSERRKRMRDELREKEEQARSCRKKQKEKDKQEQDLVDKLRKEGQQRREEQATRNVEKELEKQLRQDRKQRQAILEDRQVRLKWDRKKMKISPSEDSIASLLSQFGTVEQVELLGKKGNQALVTFQDAASCQPCVQAYANSKEMRAKFVGSRKNREEEEEEEDENEQMPETLSSRIPSGSRHMESLDGRRIRQAEERERLLRELQEDDGEIGDEKKEQGEDESHKAGLASKKNRRRSTVHFPLPFPDSEDLVALSPFDKLRKMEEHILGKLLKPKELEALWKPVEYIDENEKS